MKQEAQCNTSPHLSNTSQGINLAHAAVAHFSIVIAVVSVTTVTRSLNLDHGIHYGQGIAALCRFTLRQDYVSSGV
jgi:hypothetical protein